MILTLSNSSEGSLRTMSEVPPEIMEGHPEELLLKPEVSGGDFFASNIWFASLRISGLSTSHEHTSNEFLQSSKSFGIFLGSGGGGGSGGASSTLSLSKIYNFN